MKWPFWKKISHAGKKEPVKPKSSLREWGDAIVFAVVAAALIRWLIMDPYMIPTGSMEKSLLVGDFLFVSRFHYGTRTTTTPLQIPLTHQKIWFTNIPSYLDWIQLPQYRLPGISKVKRNDVVVFNVPDDPLDVAQYPVDLKTNYIKRCVAISGDTISIVNGQVMINGQPNPNPPFMQHSYVVTCTEEISRRLLEKYDIYGHQVSYDPSGYFVYQMYIPADVAAELKKLNFVRDVTIAIETGFAKNYLARTEKTVEQTIFPDYKIWPWNGDFFGPMLIPAKGMTIPINEKTVAMYGQTIRDYDHNKDARIENGKLVIDGREVTEYTFKQNYYFMMGDNRHQSLDSRYWGFVPEDHIVGKALFVWLSLDPHKKFLNKIRWRRIFKMIE